MTVPVTLSGTPTKICEGAGSMLMTAQSGWCYYAFTTSDTAPDPAQAAHFLPAWRETSKDMVAGERLWVWGEGVLALFATNPAP